MLVLFSFHEGDYKAACNLMLWIENLGGCKEHDILIHCPGRMEKQLEFVADICERSFNDTSAIVDKNDSDIPTGWPAGPNYFFESMIEVVDRYCDGPFLWLEPDCVPLVPDWLDLIEEAYEKSSKPFFGSINKSTDGSMTHFSGVGVYPENAWKFWKDCLPSNQAFDMVNRDVIVPMAENTRLIQNFWGIEGLAPTFKELRQKTDPINTLTLSHIRRDAVLYHRCKDGSLINLLKRRRVNK